MTYGTSVRRKRVNSSSFNGSDITFSICRYHYKKQLLYKISERQLVYGCGPDAIAFYNQLVKERSDSSIGDNAG